MVYHRASVFNYFVYLPFFLCMEEICKISNKKHLIFVFHWLPGTLFSSWSGVDSQYSIE